MNNERAADRQPTVTVLLCVYNGERYLRQAIDSVLAQTFDDLDLLVVNDASTDSTADILETYGRQDNRVRVVVNETNLGLTESLNRGLHLARGEYVARLDADDVARPDRLVRQISYLEEHGEVALVGSWQDVVDENGNRIASRKSSIRNYGEYFFLLLKGQQRLHHPTVTFRRKVVLEAGGYDESFRSAQDADLWIRLAQAGKRAAIIEEPLVQYRVHHERVTARHREEQRRNKSRAHAKMLAHYLADDDVDDLQGCLASDPEWWRDASSADMAKVVEQTGALLRAVETRGPLSPRETARVKRNMVRLVLQRAADAHVHGKGALAKPLLAFVQREDAAQILTAHGVRYALAVLGLLGIVRHVGSRWSRKSDARRQKVIFVGGTSYSGSTFLDMMLATGEDGLSLGEIKPLFFPYREHHVNPPCGCMDPECRLWQDAKEKGNRHVYRDLFAGHPPILHLVDSSKNVDWITHQSVLAESDGFDVRHVIVWKTPLEFAWSRYRRGREEGWLRSWVSYHQNYFSRIGPAYAVKYEELASNPTDVLKALCHEIGIRHFPGKERYWEHTHHTLFGNASARIHLYKKGTESYRRLHKELAEEAGQREGAVDDRHRQIRYSDDMDDAFRERIEAEVAADEHARAIVALLESLTVGRREDPEHIAELKSRVRLPWAREMSERFRDRMIWWRREMLGSRSEMRRQDDVGQDN